MNTLDTSNELHLVDIQKFLTHATASKLLGWDFNPGLNICKGKMFSLMTSLVDLG